MASAKELKLAKEAYATLCKEFDKNGWRYKKNEENLTVNLGFNGEDIPMDFVIECDAERQIVSLLSFMPYKINEDKIVEAAIATCHANYKMLDGSFDLRLSDGTIVFRLTSSFRESLIGGELFKYMLSCAVYTVDRYNDQFLMLNKGNLSLEDFIKNN